MLMTSTMVPLGTKLPDFSLPDLLSGQMITPAMFASKKVLLVMFLSRNCPFVRHIHRGLAQLWKDYATDNIGMIAICSNDPVQSPNDAPPKMRELAQALGLRFPFCFDETQAVAKAFRASITPDFFLYDENRLLVYRGQFDDSWPNNGKPVTGDSIRDAIEGIIVSRPIDPDQKPSIGCNIKWRKGNEPDYFFAMSNVH